HRLSAPSLKVSFARPKAHKAASSVSDGVPSHPISAGSDQFDRQAASPTTILPIRSQAAQGHREESGLRAWPLRLMGEHCLARNRHTGAKDCSAFGFGNEHCPAVHAPIGHIGGKAASARLNTIKRLTVRIE